jgi:hypoxanthine phosphoribosyltransferase
VIQLLEASGAEVRSVVLYTKPHTVQEATYTWRRTDRWINFPWSVQPPVVAAV